MARKSKIEARLRELEREIRERGVHLAYERLQFAGLRLQSGLCWFKGRYYLFVDRYKKPRQRIELLEGALEELDRLAAQGRLDRPFDDPEAETTPAEPAPEEAAG